MRGLLLILLCLYTIELGAQPNADACKLHVNNIQQATLYTHAAETKRLINALNIGRNKIAFTCDLEKPVILSFEQGALKSISIRETSLNIESIAAAMPSYLMPAGAYSAEFELDIFIEDSMVFYWQTIDQALHHSLINNVTMSGFYGLCLALIFYVFFVGRITNDVSFQLYSLYVFCASTFFLLQEGQLNILFPQYTELLDYYYYSLFAGFTVLSATVFIVNVTDIQLRWPRLTRYLLYPMAISALVFSFLMVLVEDAAKVNLAGLFMAHITFAIMLVVLVLVALQAWRRVLMTWLIFVSLLSMVVAMFIRLFAENADPFYERYALIIAFTFEAFIFAFVVSARIQNMKQRKLIAESEANTDELCSVLNRRGWIKQASDLLAKQKTKGGLVGVLYIDLDDFKAVNDSYGHDIGDKVLEIVANIIRNHVRQSDLVGRVGGDEFVVFGLFDSEQESTHIANRLRERLSLQTLQISDSQSLTLSASLGHYLSEDAPSITEILSKADAAMYARKRVNKHTQDTELTTVSDF